MTNIRPQGAFPLVLATLFAAAGCGSHAHHSPPPVAQKTYSLVIASSQWTDPPGIGSIIGAYVPHFLLDVVDVSDTSLHLLGALAADGDDSAQDLCQPTFDPGAGPLTGRTFAAGPVDVPITVRGYPVTVHDLSLTGTFTADGTAYVAGTFSGVLDAREFEGFFGTDATGVCDLVETVGAVCGPCPYDDAPYCLPIRAEDVSAPEVPDVQVLPLTVDDLDASCFPTDVPRCSLDEHLVAFDGARMSPGYTLVAPIQSKDTHLLDSCGAVVHTWRSAYFPGQSARLLPNGHLLRAGSVQNQSFNPGSAGGIIEEFDGDGTLLWSFEYAGTEYCLHHDFVPLPSGNIVMIAWELKTQAEAIAAGRDPSRLAIGELWPDHLIEVAPTRPTGGTIVWEWHTWDHLVQHFDPAKPNFGVVADHPERLDLNADTGNGADLHHINSIDYLGAEDQILISFRTTSEVAIIDHSTSTAEAAGHTGGASGRGGDLLYRWGNPQVYGAGAAGDQQLFGQHDAHFIPAGLVGAGHVLVFNNGGARLYSSVDELALPDVVDHAYPLEVGVAFGPDQATWSYTAPAPTDFYSGSISSAQRLPNGNTLICSGQVGDLFEITPTGTQVWRYEGDAGPIFRARRYAPEDPGIVALGLGAALSSTRPAVVPALR